jgi:hypothetical protein
MRSDRLKNVIPAQERVKDSDFVRPRGFGCAESVRPMGCLRDGFVGTALSPTPGDAVGSGGGASIILRWTVMSRRSGGFCS